MFEPLKFVPIFKEKIWGGSEIRKKFNKPAPISSKIGESWELTDIPNGRSVIAEGRFSGQTLQKILTQYPEEITGNPNYSCKSFPLMIKFIDANGDLSVQVHPDKETCQRTGKGNPKTECWYILATKPGACIYKGLKPGTKREVFEQSIKNGNCEDYLQKIEVKVGECHFLPSGVVHAIGSGILLAEIQQPSDTTYRVYDWNRVDSDGKPRELHIKDAIDCIHFGNNENLTVRSQGRLVSSEEFNVDKLTIGDKPYEWGLGKMSAVCVIEGNGVCKSVAGGQMQFVAGDTFLVPFSYEGHLESESNAVLLISTL